MNVISGKNSLLIDSASFNAAAVATAHTTGAMAPTLGNVALLPYKTSAVRYRVATDAVGTLTITAGAVTLAEINFSGETEGVAAVDVTGIEGQTQIKAEVAVTTAGTGTGTVLAALDVEVPAILSGC